MQISRVSLPQAMPSALTFGAKKGGSRESVRTRNTEGDLAKFSEETSQRIIHEDNSYKLAASQDGKTLYLTVKESLGNSVDVKKAIVRNVKQNLGKKFNKVDTINVKLAKKNTNGLITDIRNVAGRGVNVFANLAEDRKNIG